MEDPSTPAPKDLWKLTSDPERAPEQGEDITVTFEKGIPIALSFLDGGSEKVVKEPLELFLAANTLARRHGVGRVDIVEDRLVGIKVSLHHVLMILDILGDFWCGSSATIRLVLSHSRVISTISRLKLMSGHDPEAIPTLWRPSFLQDMLRFIGTRLSSSDESCQKSQGMEVRYAKDLANSSSSPADAMKRLA